MFGDEKRVIPHALIQVGYAGENFPRAIFPSMVGRPMLRAEEVRRWFPSAFLRLQE